MNPKRVHSSVDQKPISRPSHAQKGVGFDIHSESTNTTRKINRFAILGAQFRTQKKRRFWTAKNEPKNVTFF